MALEEFTTYLVLPLRGQVFGTLQTGFVVFGIQIYEAVVEVGFHSLLFVIELHTRHVLRFVLFCFSFLCLYLINYHIPDMILNGQVIFLDHDINSQGISQAAQRLLGGLGYKFFWYVSIIFAWIDGILRPCPFNRRLPRIGRNRCIDIS